MTISDRAYLFVSGALKIVGFEVGRAYCGDIAVRKGKYHAFLSVGRTSFSDMDSTGGFCTAEVEIKAQLLSAQAGFYGAQDFEQLCENALRAVCFDSDMLLRKAELSEVKKNMALGRLERTLTVTAVYTLDKEETA